MRKNIRDFLQLESASGITLFAATLAAMIWANSPLSYVYEKFTDSWLFLINEGLMAIFFLLVGLELKRGFLEDKFSRASDILMPMAAAVGGMLVPALIYLAVNYHQPVAMRGWATPVATDIAFALGVLSLFGKKIPQQLRLFLLSIAIYDDLGAILIIAFFYTNHVVVSYLIYAALTILFILLLNAFKIRFIFLYLLGGALLWVMLLNSGIHPTLAGVITALLIPETPYKGVTPVHYLESILHPWVAFLIMPVFALANAGLIFSQLRWGMLIDGVTAGIVLGLFIGKQVGVLGTVWLSVKTTTWAKLPVNTNWLELYGIALLCGIGFTMSLFLGTLSFQSEARYINEVRLGVMLGSILSGVAGAYILKLAISKRK